MRRPLFWFSVFFLAAMALSLLTEGSFGLLSAACAVLLFCLLRRGSPDDLKGTLLMTELVCLAYFAALGAMKLYQTRMEYWEPFAGQAADFTGWVREEDPYLPGRGKVWGTLRLEGEMESSRSVLLDIRGMGEELSPGGWVSGRLLIDQVRQDGDALGGVSLYCVALGEAEDVPAPPGVHPLAEITSFRWTVSQRIWERFRDQSAAVVLAMVFSRQDLLSQPVLEQMNRAGLRHLLVVSGLHLSIAVGWMMAALRYLGRKKRVGGSLGERVGDLGERSGGPGEQTGGQGERIGVLVVLPAVWLLAGLAGFSVSVVRAAVMTSLWLIGLCLGQRSDSLTSLALAALLLTVVSPPVLLQTGYQLSFSATLGVLLGSGPMVEGLRQRWKSRFHRVGPLAGWVFTGLSVTLCAQLGTLPVLAASYGQFSVWGLFTTLFAMPFATGIILLGGAGCLLSRWTAALPERLLLWAARGLARCVLALADMVDRLPVGMIPVLLPYQLGLCLLVPAAVFGYLWYRPRMAPHRARLVRRGMALTATLVLIYNIVYYHGAVLVSANGNTGAVVISAPGGTLVLAEGEDSYSHRMVSSQLLRCGGSGPLILVCPWDSSANGILWWKTNLSPDLTIAPEEETKLLQTGESVGFLPLTEEPTEVLPDIFVSHPSPEITRVEVSGRKVLKFWAGYGIIADKPLTGDLLIDMDGRMYPISSGLRPGKMFTGDTNLIFPAW